MIKKSHNIPRLPYWLIRKCMPFSVHEGFSGDIEEEFNDKVAREGKRKARRWLWIHTIVAAPRAFTSYLIWGGTMFKH